LYSFTVTGHDPGFPPCNESGDVARTDCYWYGTFGMGSEAGIDCDYMGETNKHWWFHISDCIAPIDLGPVSSCPITGTFTQGAVTILIS
jgi:hypothetical protein